MNIRNLALAALTAVGLTAALPAGADTLADIRERGVINIGVDIGQAPFGMVDGQPARLFGMNIRGMQRRGITKESRQALKHCYRMVLRSGLNLGQALEAIRRTVEPCSETNHLISFFESPSRMGFCVRGSDARRNSNQPVEEVELAGC